jgi:RNA recognition motif-containing protein
VQKKLNSKTESKNNFNNQIYTPSPNGKTVYIGNLVYTLNEKGIYNIFEKFGKIKYINIVLDQKTKKSKGIAFVHMYNASEALLAIKKLNGSNVGGRMVKVSEANFNENSLKNIKKDTEPQKKRGENVKEIVSKKKAKRRRGLNQLFDYIKSK